LCASAISAILTRRIGLLRCPIPERAAEAMRGASPRPAEKQQGVVLHSPGSAGENEIAVANAALPLDNLHSHLRQRYAVFAITLHSTGRDNPGIAVQLVPGHSQHLAAPRRSQDGEPQGRWGQAPLRRKFEHKGGYVRVWHRSMMLHGPGLGGEKVFEVAGPAGGVITGAISESSGPIENTLDPTA
jgi:hypothetical protein